MTWLSTLAFYQEACKDAVSRTLTFRDDHQLPKSDQASLDAAITYFANNKRKMAYAKNGKLKLPIGSGVTEAACKVIVKQRLCGSAMKWKEKGAATVLRLRSINYSRGRWSQFWDKVNQYGLPRAA